MPTVQVRDNRRDGHQSPARAANSTLQQSNLAADPDAATRPTTGRARAPSRADQAAPPRAQLVRLPEWRIGEQRPVLMPYNLQVLATLKGRLQSQDVLPSSGNSIGDTWIVGQTPWVWIRAPGAAQADWIDP
jgi:hypothetical protein